MSTPEEPACTPQTPQDYVASPRPPSQRGNCNGNGGSERRIEKWASEANAERERGLHFEYNRQLEALRIQNQELQARVAELECSIGRVGVAFQHLSSLNSVFHGSTIHNNNGNSNSRPRDQREHHQQYHSSNPHFQDQRREFSSHMGSQGERQSSSSSSFGGGRGRGRRGA